MTSGGGPPQLLVLLWHHWIYYKRHWGVLLLTLLTPFLLFIILYILVNNLTNGGIISTQKYQPCSPFVESPFSDGPLNALLSDACKEETITKELNTKKFSYLMQYCVQPNNHPFERVLDSGFNPESDWKCYNPYKMLGGYCEYQNGTHDFKQSYRDRWCSMTTDQILYYPMNPATKTIMNRVKEFMRDYQQFWDDRPARTQYKDVPGYISNGLNSLSEYRGSFKDIDSRVIGFPSFTELQNYTRSLSNQWKATAGVPYLWGALSFADLPKDDIISVKHASYDLLYDTTIGYDDMRTFWLQEMVERAIVEVVASVPHRGNNLGAAYKPVPSKCWEQPDYLVYVITPFVLPIVAVISFLFSPANFLNQVLTEKHLKLREYLYIMGVGSMTLKISWILFYCIFLIPLSIIFATMIYLLPGNVFSRTDPSLVFVFVIGYNVSQLAFCYMLSNALQQPRRSGIVIIFLHLFFLVLNIFGFWSLNITGSKLVLARITSLYPVVPLVIAVKYINSWEGQWIGAQWSNFFLSPVPTDEYGGIGEAFLWMIADIFIYLLLAWYFEKVFPGEFGQKLKFYFPFLPSYWCPKPIDHEFDSVNGTVDVEHVENKEPGVILEKLTKMYTRDKIGVKQLSLTFYKDEITAFLGQNGAGKSTTMNSLVGLISATSGKASVHGFEMDSQMDDIRRIVGFVPQYDILYPSMTVQEHLQFFGWLKGMTKAEIKHRTDPLLMKLGLDNVKNNITTTLSGGQKRKLSIMTGYLGDPEVIIFDEPTSGVDPFSRRSIWELILSHKKDNTTILSTHDMDEADLLGDRVAIIAQGELRCAGSPMYLKNRYGKGFRLTVACNPQFNKKETIINFISNQVENSKLVEERGTDLDFTIPIEIAHSSDIIDMLKRVEEEQHSLGIVSYGISEPTMEEVFFTAADIEKEVDVKVSHRSSPELHTNGIELGVGDDEDNGETALQYSKRVGSVSSLLEQSVALFHKRLLMAVFSWSGILLQIVLPLTFIILLLLVGGAAKSNTKGTASNVNVYDPARENIMFVADSGTTRSQEMLNSLFNAGNPPVCPGKKCSGSKTVPGKMTSNPSAQALDDICPSCRKACDDSQARQAPGGVIPSGDTVYRVGTGTNLTRWILEINQTQSNLIAGFEFHKTDSSAWDRVLGEIGTMTPHNSTFMDLVNETTPREYVTVWYQPRLRQAVVSLWNTYLLRILKGVDDVSISMNLKPVVLTDPTNNLVSAFQDVLQIYFSNFFLVLCFAFGTFGVAVFIQYENAAGLKRLQLIYGANPFVYWIVNAAFDFLLYFMTVILVAILLKVTDNAFNEDVGKIVATVLPYGFMTIAFFYLLSFLFRKAQGIVIFTVVSTLVVIFVGNVFATFEFANQICHCTWREGAPACMFGWAIPLNYFLRCIPAFLIADSLSTIAISRALAQFQLTGTGLDSCFSDIYAFNMLGKRFLMAIVWGIVYFAIVLVLEWYDARINLKKLCGCAGNRNIVVDPLMVNDADVINEKRRVEDGQASQDPLVVKGLRKVYNRMLQPAVAGITFGVTKSQTFGLLGINGAGKTTTFRLLTGYLDPTEGEAVLENHHLFGNKKSWTRFRDSSYCPQENTLFDSLTVEQHLSLFAKLRSIPTQFIPDIIRSSIHEVGLQPHKGKRADQLSGGNQRKLQFALALLDYRPVIFLDEPTTGMDPGARRKAWNSIKRATDRGCSVVLTSHSMEECEALCHRIVIMVSGSFQCIGSVQYLKDKFGNKYTFKIKLRPKSATQADDLDQGSACNRVKQFIHERVPYSQLQEEHATMLHFDVPCTPQLKLSDLFKVLSECRAAFAVEDVSVTQTTLEQVFINMARVQEMLQNGMVQQQMTASSAPQLQLQNV